MRKLQEGPLWKFLVWVAKKIESDKVGGSVKGEFVAVVKGAKKERIAMDYKKVQENFWDIFVSLTKDEKQKIDFPDIGCIRYAAESKNNKDIFFAYSISAERGYCCLDVWDISDRTRHQPGDIVGAEYKSCGRSLFSILSKRRYNGGARIDIKSDRFSFDEKVALHFITMQYEVMVRCALN